LISKGPKSLAFAYSSALIHVSFVMIAERRWVLPLSYLKASPGALDIENELDPVRAAPQQIGLPATMYKPSAAARKPNFFAPRIIWPNFLRANFISASDSFLLMTKIFRHVADAPAFVRYPWCGLENSLSRKLFDNPGGKIALGLLGCPKSGQLCDLHGLNGRANRTPAPTNPHVFGQFFGKLNHAALRNLCWTSNDEFDFTTCRQFS
jgi:hypothetical protein